MGAGRLLGDTCAVWCSCSRVASCGRGHWQAHVLQWTQCNSHRLHTISLCPRHHCRFPSYPSNFSRRYTVSGGPCAAPYSFNNTVQVACCSLLPTCYNVAAQLTSHVTPARPCTQAWQSQLGCNAMRSASGCGYDNNLIVPRHQLIMPLAHPAFSGTASAPGPLRRRAAAATSAGCGSTAHPGQPHQCLAPLWTAGAASCPSPTMGAKSRTAWC